VTGSDLDIAALLVRLALGLMLCAHGANKVWGAGGLAGTEGWFAALGLRPAAVHARMAAVTELAAGTAVALGFLTPLACAAFVGLMVVAARTDHRGKGFFVFKGGWEYVAMVAVVAIALATSGPGAWSLDFVLGLEEWHGAWWALGMAVLGSSSAALLLIFSFRPGVDLPETST
jgi:putative oxidoreductase